MGVIVQEVSLQQRHCVRRQELAEGIPDVAAHSVGFRCQGQQGGDDQQGWEDAENCRIGSRLRIIERPMSKGSPEGASNMIEDAERIHLSECLSFRLPLVQKFGNRSRIRANQSLALLVLLAVEQASVLIQYR